MYSIIDKEKKNTLISIKKKKIYFWLHFGIEYERLVDHLLFVQSSLHFRLYLHAGPCRQDHPRQPGQAEDR